MTDNESKQDSSSLPILYSKPEKDFKIKHRQVCRCGKVCFVADADPVDAKFCHCLDCQKCHSVFQWAVIFHKKNIRSLHNIDDVCFYSHENEEVRMPPCKVICKKCHTIMADEGRNMWLSMGNTFVFNSLGKIPHPFKPSCHIFYGSRAFDVNDGITKWSGHKGKSMIITEKN